MCKKVFGTNMLKTIKNISGKKSNYGNFKDNNGKITIGCDNKQT